MRVSGNERKLYGLSNSGQLHVYKVQSDDNKTSLKLQEESDIFQQCKFMNYIKFKDDRVSVKIVDISRKFSLL